MHTSLRLTSAVVGMLLAMLALTSCGSDEPDAKNEPTAEGVTAAESELQAEKDAETAALKEGQALLADMTTYSWQEGKHEFAWSKRLTSDDLKAKLLPNLAKFKELIVQQKISAKGKVIDSAGRAIDSTHVEMLAFVDQAIARGNDPEIKVDEQRVSMSLVLKDGQWMVERLDLHSGAISQ